MIQLVLYDLPEQIINNSFLKNDEKITVIVPSPTIADEIRSYPDFNHSWELLTISKFISNQLGDVDVWRKSKLYFELAMVWKKKFGDNFNKFEKIFYYFTELRSLSLNLSLIREFLEPYLDTEDLSQIELFWIYVEQRGIIDEQLSYFLLSEKYRSSNIQVDDTIDSSLLVCGFKFLSASQIDLLNSFSIKNTLYISLPQNVYKNLKYSDWPNWFTYDVEIDQTTQIVGEKTTNVIRFPKGRMSEKISEMNSKNVRNVFICSKNIDFEHYNELPIENKVSKIKFTAFEIAAFSILETLKGEIFLNNLNVLEFIKILEEMTACYFKKQNFIFGKVCQMFIDSFNEWGELSNENHDVLNFDLDIISNIILLDLPRSFLLNQSLNEYSCEVKNVSNSLFLDFKSEFFICSTSNYGTLFSNTSLFNEELSIKLRTIGPLRRGGLETLFLLTGIQSLLSSKYCTLLLEDDLEKNDPFWKMALADLNFLPEVKKIGQPKIVEFNHFNFERSKTYKDTLNLSPSKIQMFIDCPLQFYINHVERLSKIVPLTSELRPFDIGTIEHLVIELYFSSKIDTFGENYKALVLSELTKYLLNKKIKLDKSSFNRSFIEIFYYSKNGISFLLNFKKIMPSIRFTFEYTLGDEHRQGRADLIFESDTHLGIIDFKRSSGSIPSKIQVLQFSKIQTLFYLSRLTNKDKNKKFLFGYLNLSDVSSSLFFCNDECIVEEVSLLSNIYDDTEQVEALNVKKIKIIKIDNVLELVDSYILFENEVCANILNERIFKPEPVKSSVCTYCDLKNICSKGS